MDIGDKYVVETQGEEDDVDDRREIHLNLLFPSSRAQPIQEPSPWCVHERIWYRLVINVWYVLY